MWSMLFDSSECMRYCITLFNDGHGIRCEDEEENQICSRCESNRSHPQLIEKLDYSAITSTKRKTPTVFETAHQAAKMRRVDITAEEQRYVEGFQKALVSFRDVCPICLLYMGIHEVPHSIQLCPIMEEEMLRSYMSVKKQIHYDDKMHDPICFYCNIPICHNLLHPPYGTKQSCIYPSVVLCVAWAVFNGKGSHTQLETRFNQRFPSMNTYVAWLNSQPIPGHKSNLTAVFLWFTAKVFDL
jgi:hypothetical protein